uniref:Cardiomyopathy-associated protein 5 n=1 Tax=Angiostrongylus cantonensis TaxID=6313 RepID=A0A0K0D113_ANGCA
MQHENEQMVYREKFMVEHSPCLQIECHSIKRQDSEDLERKRLEEEDIIEERYTDWNTHDVFELPPSVADAHESQQSSAPSLEGKEFCTEHMRYEQMVYGGKITVEPSHLLGVDMERNRLESLTLTTLCDSNQSEEIHPRRSSSYSSSEEEVIIEEGDTDWNAHDVHEVSASVADAHESQQSSAPSLEEKEICTEHMRYEQMVYRGKITVEPSHLLEEKDIEQKYTDWNAHDVHEVSSSVESQQSSAPSLEEKEICTGHMRHELVGDGGKITVELSHLLGEDVERNRLEKEKDIEHKYTDWNAHDVHEVSSSVESQQSSAPSLEEQEICTGHMRYEPMVYGGKITVEPSHLLGEDVERNRMEQEKDIEQRYTDWNTHDVCEVPPSVADAHESQQSSAPSLEEKEISTDHMRIQMKNTCISLWSDKVQQLPELLYILKLCHNIYGPLSITSCEEIIEVQPVDCILMSKFHMLLRGLISEVYEVLLKSKKGKTLKEVMEMMTAFLKASDDFSRLDEIKKAILTVPEVIRISDDYLELCNDDAFFVITDVDIQPSGMTSSDNS